MTARSAEDVNVLIVGAGLSGIGAAVHLQTHCPGKRFVILESRSAMGGTWDLFRYPGIRSDSDMFTLGYSFRPWEDAKAIADGPAILKYIQDTARDHGVEQMIRFNHRVLSANWSSNDAKWIVQAQRTDTGERVQFTCDFLYGCTGYYRYDEGYTPKFKGTERFKGKIIHPQHWPHDLDYAGKRVVVIGSGATAVTLVPALSEKAAHVTMLQRSPTYIVSLPAKDKIADALRKYLPKRLAYRAVRWKNIRIGQASYQLSRRAPKLMRRIFRRGVERLLPKEFDVGKHFGPSYDPWDQRLCLVPDGDLFRAIRHRKADVVTDRISEFTEKGLKLESGAELEADIIVTATGLNLLLFGGIEVRVDGEKVEPSQRVAYKGLMLSGVPNFAFAIGYTNASWTLKCDLVAEYVCRLLKHMDQRGYRVVIPKAPDPALPTEPIIDLKSGYVLRSIDQLPKQGAKTPWRLNQNYELDVQLLKTGALDEGLEYRRR